MCCHEIDSLLVLSWGICCVYCWAIIGHVIVEHILVRAMYRELEIEVSCLGHAVYSCLSGLELIVLHGCELCSDLSHFSSSGYICSSVVLSPWCGGLSTLTVFVMNVAGEVQVPKLGFVWSLPL